MSDYIPLFYMGENTYPCPDGLANLFFLKRPLVELKIVNTDLIIYWLSIRLREFGIIDKGAEN